MIGDIFHMRRWWTADVRRSPDGLWLYVRRGSRHVTIWRRTLLPFHESIEPTERIHAEVGDAFVCCGPSIDETVSAVVEQVEGERLRVTVGGGLAATTRTVQLLAMYGLKQEKKRKAA